MYCFIDVTNCQMLVHLRLLYSVSVWTLCLCKFTSYVRCDTGLVWNQSVVFIICRVIQNAARHWGEKRQTLCMYHYKHLLHYSSKVISLLMFLLNKVWIGYFVWVQSDCLVHVVSSAAESRNPVRISFDKTEARAQSVNSIDKADKSAASGKVRL